MNLTRQTVVKQVKAFRALVDKSPKLGRTRINLSTLLDYCEALMKDHGIEYRSER